eukprot:GFKZ01003033.1.p1 GENE.GFKZ01003033.1~~GFKZ01003033.1.p1  ORF type:complete len:479 (+),score=52.18 GFKZ01003033.1:485-1921(+)
MATAQLAADFNIPITQSYGVRFFQGTPRWPTASSQFDFSFDYLTPVALTALIPLFVALVFVSLFILQLTCRYTFRESKVNARIYRMHTSRNYSVLQISLAVLLTLPITAFIALAVISVVALNFSFNDGLDMINAVASDLFLVATGIVDVGILFENRIRQFEPSFPIPSFLNASLPLIDPSLNLGNLTANAISAARTYILDRFPDFEPLDEAIHLRFDQVTNVLSVTRRAVDIVSAGLLAIVLFMLSAPALHFFVDALPLSKRFRPSRIIFHVLIVLVPTLLAWSFFGVTSAVGATLSDICVSLHDYRAVLLGTLDSSTVPENVFVKGNVLCPGVDATEINEQFSGTMAAVLQNEFARDIIQNVLSTTAESIASTTDWTRDRVGGYTDCTQLIRFSGQLEFIGCGREGKSAVQAVFDLWVAFLGMSIALTVAVFLSLWGVRIGWGLLVWPRENVENQLDISRSEAENEPIAEVSSDGAH